MVVLNTLVAEVAVGSVVVAYPTKHNSVEIARKVDVLAIGVVEYFAMLLDHFVAPLPAVLRLLHHSLGFVLPSQGRDLPSPFRRRLSLFCSRLVPDVTCNTILQMPNKMHPRL